MAKRGMYAKTPARREEILDAALAAFARSGYLGLSLHEVASAVGMSAAGLLHHFGSREVMLAAVLRRREELLRSGNPDRGAVEGLGAAMRENSAVPGLVKLHSVLAAQAGEPDHPAHGYFSERYAAMRARLEIELEERATARGLDLDPKRVATILIALADGLQIQWMLDESVGMAEHYDHLLSLVGLDD